MRVKLLNVVAPSRRYEEAVAFYRDVLALKVIDEGTEHCFLSLGSVNLAIHPTAGDSEFTFRGPGLYLDLAVDDLTAAKRTLELRGIRIQKEWQDEKGRFMLITDPDGNLIELIERSTADKVQLQ
jgi:catechol 2,3-dioxygenase-like lactoylglutathione lyase family enzyme